MEEVKLHGFWASPFSHRVIWALKLKGVEYDYVEEDSYNKKTWSQSPLLPTDAYHKAIARFWIQFGVDKACYFHSLFQATGEEQEKAAKEVLEILKILEDQGLGEKKFFGGDTINLVDIAHGWMAYWFETIEKVVGVILLEARTLPRLYAWVQNLKEVGDQRKSS
ncbi:hypothetical protein QYF36_018125 [Acer negundo]|nr:hypothetical protein QYF36_018125 [Acer negundo]